MSTALAVSDTQTEWTPDQYSVLLMQGISPAISPTELRYFLAVCQKTRLDPFTRQIYLVGRWSKKHGREVYTPQTSIDGFRVIAERTGHYEGQTTPQWCGPDGQWRDVWLEETPPSAARIGVYRKSFREPLYAVALWKEYVQKDKKTSLPTKFWADMGAHMLSKVSESLALRKAFPQDLSGLYTVEEYQPDENETPTDLSKALIPQPKPAAALTPADFTITQDWEQAILIAMEDTSGEAFYNAQKLANTEEPKNLDLKTAFRYYWIRLPAETQTKINNMYATPS